MFPLERELRVDARQVPRISTTRTRTDGAENRCTDNARQMGPCGIGKVVPLASASGHCRWMAPANDCLRKPVSLCESADPFAIASDQWLGGKQYRLCAFPTNCRERSLQVIRVRNVDELRPHPVALGIRLQELDHRRSGLVAGIGEHSDAADAVLRYRPLHPEPRGQPEHATPCDSNECPPIDHRRTSPASAGPGILRAPTILCARPVLAQPHGTV